MFFFSVYWKFSALRAFFWVYGTNKHAQRPRMHRTGKHATIYDILIGLNKSFPADLEISFSRLLTFEMVCWLFSVCLCKLK